MVLAMPPWDEQDSIVDFLDYETGKIQNLIAQQQRLIELLKEKRQAVISHAVTKGLDHKTPMKDSSVDWLGDVPSHWVVSKIGRYLNILSGFAFPSAEFSHDESETRLLRGINVGVQEIRWTETVYWARKPQDGLDRFELFSGDIVIGMDRPWVGAGTRIAAVRDCDLPCLLLQRVAALRPDALLSTAFLYVLLQSREFVDHFTPDMTGVSVPHISPEQIGAFVVAMPPVDEQLQIIDFLERKCRDLDMLREESESAIALLQERRATLIAAAVTGKIDVRGLAKKAEAA